MRLLIAVGVVLLFAGSASARTWTNREGKQIEAKLLDVVKDKGKTHVIIKRKGIDIEYRYRVSDLSRDDRDYVKTYLARKEKKSVGTSVFAKALDGKLVRVSRGNLKDYKLTRNVDYYAFYFSAHWCPPCRKFTPKLVDFYARNKSKRDKFEIIFISSDRSANDMLKYMKETGMKWPGLKYNQRNSAGGVTKYAGDGIPCLVVVDRKGKVIADSYQNGRYVGPYPPMQRLEALLK